MKLPLDAAVLCAGAVDEIPVAPGASVVSPMRYGWHVAENCVQRDPSLVAIAEILCPGIDFFLTGRVPRHLASEGICLLLPAIGALAHFGFELIRKLGHSFSLEIKQ